MHGSICWRLLGAGDFTPCPKYELTLLYEIQKLLQGSIITIIVGMKTVSHCTLCML